MRYQRSRNLSGDLLEIGVYHGRYFVELCQELGPRECAVAIDIFETATPTIDGSAQGNIHAFNENLDRYAPATPCITIIKDSALLTTGEVLTRMAEFKDPHPFRFISIDGSHDYDHVIHDISLGEVLLTPGGVIAIDDWHPSGNKQWPEVEKAISDAVAILPALHVIGTIPNKLLVSNARTWANDYRAVLRDWSQNEHSEQPELVATDGTDDTTHRREGDRRVADDGSDGNGTDDHGRGDHHGGDGCPSSVERSHGVRAAR